MDEPAVRIETNRSRGLSTARLKSFLALATSVVLPCSVGLTRRGNDTDTERNLLL
jgi:hypothetical protein